jgi:hypothetical protein
MKLENVRRIIAEDFPKDQQNLVNKLAIILNNFMETTFNVLNNNVNFDNLSAELVTIKVTVDKSGIPTTDTKFSTTKIGNASGGWVLGVSNLTNSNSYVSSAPFVDFTNVSDKLFQIKHVCGLTENQQYSIQLVVFSK